MMHTNDYKFDKNMKYLIHVPKSGGTTFCNLVKKYNLNIIADGYHKPISKYCNVNEYYYILILRNPINRVISYFNMVKRGGINYPHGKYVKNYKTFLNNCWVVNNCLTLYLAGIDCEKIHNNKNIKDIKLIVNDNIYEKAKQNLDKIKKIIFFENYEKNIYNFFNKEYNITLEKIPNIRNFKYSKNISENDYKLILDHNKYDLLLYEYACNKYSNI